MLVDFKGLNLADDVNYIVTSLDGWESRPEVVNGSVPRARRHGSVRGSLLAYKRVISVSILIPSQTTDGNTTTKAKADLMRAMSLDDEESPLRIGLDYGSPITLAYVRVTAFDMPTVKGYGQLATANIEFTATDPRRYSDQNYTATGGLRTRPPGKPYPQVAIAGRFTYTGGTGTAGSYSISNDGNADSVPRFTIKGPINNPSITIQDNKDRRKVWFAVSLTASERLTIDPSQGLVKEGSKDRYAQVRGAIVEDLYFRPGISTISFGGSSSSPSDPRLTTTWRDATI